MLQLRNYLPWYFRISKPLKGTLIIANTRTWRYYALNTWSKTSLTNKSQMMTKTFQIGQKEKHQKSPRSAKLQNGASNDTNHEPWARSSKLSVTSFSNPFSAASESTTVSSLRPLKSCLIFPKKQLCRWGAKFINSLKRWERQKCFSTPPPSHKSWLCFIPPTVWRILDLASKWRNYLAKLPTKH